MGLTIDDIKEYCAAINVDPTVSKRAQKQAQLVTEIEYLSGLSLQNIRDRFARGWIMVPKPSNPPVKLSDLNTVIDH